MTLTKEELEKLMTDFMIQITKAKAKGNFEIEQQYQNKLKLLELAHTDYERYRKRK